MKPADLLHTARDLVSSSNGKPRQSNLLRATSTAYYALFHALARSCADLLIGGSGAVRSKSAWHQAYRALEHGVCKNACKNGKIANFPQEIQDFANLFVTMQEKRHIADYDPNAKVFKSTVLLDIEQVEFVITSFEATPLKDRRAFAAFVLFKQRAS
ncbi:hypothetical protein [Pelagibacterium sp.]|uniref:hypothetical protein n=1 Tax=Pelagibacterium sp. TaxID=1967288 RepID=UPI003BAC70A3